MFICMQKINFISTSLLRYCENIVNLIFLELCECLTISIEIIVSICGKTAYGKILICKQKINFNHSLLSENIAEKRQTHYFGKFGHGWPHTPKMIVSIWKNLSVTLNSVAWFLTKLLYFFHGIAWLPNFWCRSVWSKFNVKCQESRYKFIAFFAWSS